MLTCLFVLSSAQDVQDTDCGQTHRQTEGSIISLDLVLYKRRSSSGQLRMKCALALLCQWHLATISTVDVQVFCFFNEQLEPLEQWSHGEKEEEEEEDEKRENAEGRGWEGPLQSWMDVMLRRAARPFVVVVSPSPAISLSLSLSLALWVQYLPWPVWHTQKSDADGCIDKRCKLVWPESNFLYVTLH